MKYLAILFFAFLAVAHAYPGGIATHGLIAPGVAVGVAPGVAVGWGGNGWNGNGWGANGWGARAGWGAHGLGHGAILG